MLGIGNNLTKSGGGIRSIIKKGLQAWYKADNTQAPLGEEKLANGDFSLGPELLEQPNFNVEGVLTKDGDRPERWYLVPLDGIDDPNYSASISNNQLTISVGGTVRDSGTGRVYGFSTGGQILFENKTYELTYTVVASENTGSDFKVYTANQGYVTIPSTVGTHTEYFTYDEGTNGGASDAADRDTLPFLLNKANSSITLSNISLKRTNPNDSWTLSPESSTSAGDGWNVKDGFIEAVGTGNNDDIKQTILTVGKKYRVTLTASDGMGSGTNFYVGDEHFEQDDYAQISTNGTHTHEWTASHTVFVIRRKSDTTVKLSNVSVKEVTNSIRDYSSNNNDATLYSGTALYFDGADADDGSSIDHVTLDYPVIGTTVDSNFKCTIALWFNATTLGQRMVFSTAQNGDNRFYLWTKNNKLQFSFGDNPGNPTTGTMPSVVASRWYRVVIVVDGLNAYLYLDGEYQYHKQSGAFSGTLSSNLTLGRHGSTSNYEYDGMISDFQAYDTCWTASDVTYDWNNPDKDVFDDEGRAEVLGSELVTNGNFSTSGNINHSSDPGGASYNLGFYDGGEDAGITISDGALNLFKENTDANSGRAYVSNGVDGGIGLTDGKTYKISYTIKENSASSGFQIWDGAAYNTVTSTVGSHVYYFVHNGTHLVIKNNGNYNNTPTIKISSFSVKKVTTHAGEISPTNCKTLLRLNEGAGTRLYDAAPVLGANLITNGDFSTSGSVTTSSTSLGWVLASSSDTGVAITNGQLVLTGNGEATGGRVYAGQTSSGFLNAGTVYELTYTIDENSGTDLRYHAGTSYVSLPSEKETVGTHTIIFTAGASEIFILLQNTGGGVTKFSNVSVKEITLSNSFLYVDGDNDTTEWKTAQPYIPQLAMSSYSKKAIFGGAGSGDYVTLGSGSNIDELFDGGGSWSVWVSGVSDGGNSTGTILSKSQCRLRVIQDTGDDLTLEFLQTWTDGSSADNGLWRCPTTALLENKLNHIVVSYNSDSASNDPIIYINGVSQTLTETLDPGGTRDTDAGSNLVIGNVEASATDHNWDGFIDEVAIFDKILTEDEVEEIFNSGLAKTSNNNSYSNCKGYWRNNGIDTWTDLSPNSNDGTVNGSPTTINLQEVPYFKKDTFGLPMNKVRQRAINYNQDSYLESGSNVNFGTNDFSFECWVQYNYKDIGSGWNVILHNGSMSQDGTGFGLASDTNRFAVRLNGNTAHAYIGASSGLNEGQWYHVAVTRSGTTLKTYLDTAEETHTISAENVTTTTPFRVGRDTTTSRYYTGLIDDVKIYDRALSKKEIEKNHKATRRSHNTTNTKIWSDQLNDNLV